MQTQMLRRLSEEPNWSPEAAEWIRTTRPETGEAYDVQLSHAERYARGLGLRLFAGLWLFPHALWRLLRMRNLWILLALLTVVNTAATLSSSGVYPVTPGMYQSFDTAKEVRDAFAAAGQRWADPWFLGRNYLEGTHGPAGVPFAFVERLVMLVELRLAGDRFELASISLQHPWSHPWALLYALALPQFLGAVFVAGMLGLILAGLREEKQNLAAFWSGIRAGTWRIFVWLLVVYLVTGWSVFLFAFRGRDQVHLLGLERSVSYLVLLPFMFTTYLIVARGLPLFAAIRASARVFFRRAALVIALLLPYRVLSDLITTTERGLRFGFFLTWDPAFHYRFLMPLAAYALLLAEAAVTLTLCTACTLIVLRTPEADRAAASSG